MATTLHSTLSGSELHFSKIFRSPPNTTPLYVGQSTFDFNYGILYIAANTASSADWQAVVGAGGTNSLIQVATTTYTVLTTQNSSTFVMSNPAARTITLPTAPINGFKATILDGADNADSVNITVTCGGSDLFQNGTTSFVINSKIASYTFAYDFSTTTWVIADSYVGSIFNGLLGDSLSSADNTKQLAIELHTATTATTTTLNFAQTANRTLTFPDITDTIVSKNSTDILTNKSFNSATIMLAANQLRFNNAGNTFYTSIIGGNNSANLSLTLPITSPVAGQSLISSDTIGTLTWTTNPVYNEQQYLIPSPTSVLTTVDSSTSSVLLEEVSGLPGFPSLCGIVSGIAGQIVNLVNNSNHIINIYLLDSRAPSNNQIAFSQSSPIIFHIDSVAQFVYNGNLSKWYLVSISFT